MQVLWANTVYVFFMIDVKLINIFFYLCLFYLFFNFN